MAEPARARLQPTLVERLTDDAPSLRSERRDVPAGAAQLRAAVLRDLACLFNAVCHDADGRLDAYPELRRSVLNFGLPALSGRAASGLAMRDLERDLRQAILRFEPRLLPDSVRVSALDDGRDPGSHNVIELLIEGQLRAQPALVALSLHTRLDLESGQCLVSEFQAARASR
jgi:type VI secretion system protein ImpF